MSFLAEPKVQSYVDSVFGACVPTAYFDWNGGYVIGEADFTAVMTRFVLNTGAEASTQNVTDIGVFPGVEQPAVISAPDGTLWISNDTIGVVDALVGLNTTVSPWAIAQQWGSSGSVPLGWPYAYCQCWLVMGGTNWIVAGEHLGGHVNVARADPGNLGFYGHHFSASVDEDVAVCAGPQSASSATAFWVGAEGTFGKTVISNGAQSYDPATWPTPNPDIASTLVGTYVPTDFDAAWGSLFIQGVAWDQTDNNVIIQVSGTGGGNPQYIAKLNANTGAIIWKTAVSNADGFGTGNGPGMMMSRIKTGTYLYYAQTGTWSGTVYAIDTSSGSAATQSVTGLGAIGYQVSDDVLGAVFGTVGWNSSDGSIILLNNTASSGNTFGAVYFTTGAGGGGGWSNNNYPALNRAWSFTMDGHTFYVLPLGPQGTWVFDASTREWSKWDTDTYGTFWNMIHGCMWGYRVVACSGWSTDVWELAPSLLLDENIWEINHAVTGILDVRSRKYYAVDSIRITASAGLLDDIGGATFTFQYSDDQGVTWSVPFTITLTESNSTQEIVWRSMGSFAAPGRVFQFSDVGGLVRIDGADVAIDNFDEDQEQQQ